jgi:Xaa-Pro aminopeptidase
MNPITKQELESRHGRIREFLTEQDLGALFAYSPPFCHQWGQTGHVSYLSGWGNQDRLGDSAVVIPVSGSPAVLFTGLPYMKEQVAEVSPIEDLRIVSGIDPNAVAVDRKATNVSGIGDFASETLAVLERNGLADKPVGVVGVENMPTPFFEFLSHSFGDRLKRVPDIVAGLRSVKSPAEVERMRLAARLSDLGFETMLRAARPGMRGVELVAEMERAVRGAGADVAKYWMASGPAPDWGNSRIDIKPHERELRNGDLIAACSYVVYKGYWCHGQRTGTLAKPSKELSEIYGIALEAQEAGLARMRPGAPVGQVAAAIRESAARHDFQLDGGRVGHGMGADYSERPNLSESNEDLLEHGTTAVVHACFKLPGSGKMFIPLGDVCHVTPDGPEFLMEFPRTLFLAGA